jgi:hypothetical protein
MQALRRLGSELGVFVLWLVHFLPMRWIGAIGSGLGWLLYQFGRGHVTRVNLALCFPDMASASATPWDSGTSACSGATPSSSRSWCGAASGSCSS